jgi:hypothetical protein
MKYNNSRGKPHQHLIPWDAHMVKSQNTIVHTVICTTTKFPTNITKGNTRKRGVILQASQLHNETMYAVVLSFSYQPSVHDCMSGSFPQATRPPLPT